MAEIDEQEIPQEIQEYLADDDKDEQYVNPKTNDFLDKWDRKLPPERRCYGIKLLFAGCESQEFRDGLYRVGVRHILLSFYHAYKWLRKWPLQKLQEEFAKFDFVFLDSGGFSVHQAKKEGKDLKMDLKEYTEMYYKEIERIGPAFSGCAEVDVWDLGEDYLQDHRFRLLEAGVPIVPVIRGHELIKYEDMGWWENFPYVAVGSAVTGPDYAGYLAEIYRMAKSKHLLVHGFGITSAKAILTSQFYSVDSTTWLGGARYGNTMLFENGRIRYYDHTKKQVRKRFKNRFEENGLVYEKIMADDWLEVNLMNAVAWRQWAEYIKYTATRSHWLTAEEKSQAIELKSKMFNAEGVIDRAQSIQRAERRRLSLIDDAGYDDRAHETLHCNTCHISGRCPRFKDGQPCGYDINIRLERHSDLKKAIRVVLEAEFGRVMTGVLFEKIEGGVLDRNLSEEMQKFLGMVSTAKEIFDIRGEEELTIKAKGQTGAVASMLASVFQQGQGRGSTGTQRAAAKQDDVIDADYEEKNNEAPPLGLGEGREESHAD